MRRTVMHASRASQGNALLFTRWHGHGHVHVTVIENMAAIKTQVQAALHSTLAGPVESPAAGAAPHPTPGPEQPTEAKATTDAAQTPEQMAFSQRRQYLEEITAAGSRHADGPGTERTSLKVPLTSRLHSGRDLGHADEAFGQHGLVRQARILLNKFVMNQFADLTTLGAATNHLCCLTLKWFLMLSARPPASRADWLATQAPINPEQVFVPTPKKNIPLAPLDVKSLTPAGVKQLVNLIFQVCVPVCVPVCG
jgi:hypothetical protein